MANRPLPARRQLRRFLEREKKTQTWLGEQVGLTVSGVNDILSGRCRPSWEKAKRLSVISGIPATDFLEAR